MAADPETIVSIPDLIEEPLRGAMLRAGSVSEWQLVASMAISAKRQADALERIADALGKPNNGASIIDYLSGIAERG